MYEKAGVLLVGERLCRAFIQVVHSAGRDVDPMRVERVKTPPFAGFAGGGCHAWRVLDECCTMRDTGLPIATIKYPVTFGPPLCPA